ncbi:YncE family protein [Ferruginibacter albus]|uniref:YncE family protein n=1 Tax=Ferruginibacter albus TaxID=2875540 RepID=UPI001CC5C8F9|nr:YncE family protein [Ferruginibacter albus]UAY51252.1 YncE family protein [Ferruginibacter albus]
MKHIIKTTVITMLVGISMSASAQSKSGYHVINTFHMAGTTGWDYIKLDPGSNKLFQSHGTQVNILDRTTGDSLGVIPNTTGVHGIAFVNSMNKGYTSNGKLNTVTVFDLTSFKILKQVPTDQNPDAIMYDGFSKKIITCNGRGKNLSIIDPQTDTVVATIALEGKPEEAVSDDAGKLYVNLEDKSEIAEVDITANKVLQRWAITPGESPTGLAFDKKTKRLFAGCDNQLLIVLDAVTGKVITKLPIGDECDGTAFDPTLKYIFASCGDGTLTVISEESENEFKIVDKVATKKGARTITIDEHTHYVYLPTAEFEPLPVDADKKTKPKIIPGSFQIIVLGR